MKEKQSYIDWQQIKTIASIGVIGGGIIFGYAQLYSKVEFIAENMKKIEKTTEIVQKHDTDIALINQLLGIK